MAKKKFVVFENYQGRGELEITEGPEIKEADEVMDVVRAEIIRRNAGRDKDELISELDEGLLLVVNCGVILRLSEDEVNDVYILEIKE